MWQLRPGRATGNVAANSGAGTVTYFFSERFEASPGYDNAGWSEAASTGTVDEDYTGVVLEGAQSLRLVASTQHPNTRITLPSDQGELWVFFKLRVVTSLNAARRVVCFFDTGGAELNGVALNANNTIAPLVGGAAGTATVDALTNNTTYNFWWHTKKSTGANDGIGTIGFSTGTTEVTSGNAFTSVTNGTSTSNNHSLSLQITNAGGSNGAGEIILDQILISTTGTIGDNPA